MNRVTKTILYISCFMFLLATNCFAFAIVGDATHVKLEGSDYRPASGFSGGQFKLTTSLNETYAAFCVEYEEYMRFNSHFKIDSVKNYATNGGGGGLYGDNGASMVNGEYRDRLNIKTKWLMNEYVNGDLKSLYSGYDKGFFGAAFQVAVWDIEDEGYDLDTRYDYSAYETLADELISLAKSGVEGMKYKDFYNVKVVNLVDAYGRKAQSQLIAAAVPEPSTMLLLGVGLIGIAGISRKKFRK